MEELKTFVLKKIKPDKEKQEKIKDFVRSLLSTAKIASNAQPVMTGSIGRETWLKDNHDIDLFLMFSITVSREKLEKRGLEAAKKIVKLLNGTYIKKYAEHPYLQAKINDFDVDIVPCYKIKKGEKIKSAVDRSPLHVEYVLEKLEPSLRDDVRLLKQFCRGIGIYGSDAKHSGVSGYLCELLIINYGRFEEVLKAISNSNPGLIIDIENFWFKDLTKIDETKKQLRKKFKNQPLIFIDPVDKNRNVASALSCENFIRFVNKAGEFLKNPGQQFFFPVKKGLAGKQVKILQSRKTKFLSIAFSKPDIIDDNLYPQLRKTIERLTNLMIENEFKVIRKYEFVLEDIKKIVLIFEMEEWCPPFIEKRTGPPIFAIKNSRDFLKKYENPLFGHYIEDSCWVIEKEREFKTASILLTTFLNKEPDELKKKGIPKDIAEPISKANLLQHEEFWGFIKNNKELSIFLREKYFEDNFNSK